MIHIITGEGKGKTTSAVGMAVRAVGNGMNVIFVQFLKGMDSGEVKALKSLNIKVERVENIKDFDYKNIPYLKEKQDEMLKNAFLADSDMLILDEVLVAYNNDYITKSLLTELMDNYKGELVLTGRGACKEILEKAEYISEIKFVKHPYEEGIEARKGIEY
ncbi:MAG: cob(I)yrinic acid a,c-diamide adenosyltransferase [Firmicutes bacterium]|nr:cob(I)yrinic acid a,c-diamide adenosyltransferase [Bacillota bacterium]